MNGQSDFRAPYFLLVVMIGLSSGCETSDSGGKNLASIESPCADVELTKIYSAFRARGLEFDDAIENGLSPRVACERRGSSETARLVFQRNIDGKRNLVGFELSGYCAKSANRWTCSSLSLSKTWKLINPFQLGDPQYGYSGYEKWVAALWERVINIPLQVPNCQNSTELFEISPVTLKRLTFLTYRSHDQRMVIDIGISDNRTVEVAFEKLANSFSERACFVYVFD